MIRTFKYHLWTNTSQERELDIMLETHRRLYNESLSLKTMVWECYKEDFSFNEQRKWFSGQRNGLNPWYARTNQQSGQRTLKRLDKAFQNFFRRVKNGEKPGYPRYKGKDHWNTIEFQYDNGCKLNEENLYIQYIGNIRTKLHRKVEGKIKTAVLKKEAGKWYVCFACEVVNSATTASNNPPIGIDVGLESFLTTSEGEKEANPRYLKKELPNLRRIQRSFARKTNKRSNRRRKVKYKLQKSYLRIRNLRNECHYKIAHKLVHRYGLIAVESLNIASMVGNGRFSRSIQDAGWGQFLGILKHKAEKAGASVVEVDPRGTTQDCSQCGWVVPKDITVRWHDCPFCLLSMDRDVNAAKNILSLGLRQVRTEPAELNVSDYAMRVPESPKGTKSQSAPEPCREALQQGG